MADELELSLGDLDARFTDPFSAADYLESIRWPDGPVCPHCGESERKPYRLKHQTRKLWKCAACRKQFTVTVGTIFEASHVPLHKWLLAFYLLCSSKKGMSAHQLHRMLGVTYKTAWFIFHRVREAMRDPAFTSRLSGTVEADETYIGGRRPRSRQGMGRPGPKDKNKAAVLSLIERDGRARSFHVARVDAAHLRGAIRQHVERDASIMTDEWRSYEGLGSEFASHETVSHGKGEYARGAVNTNSVEGYFATEAGRQRHLSPHQSRSPTPLSQRVRLPLLDARPERRSAHSCRAQPGGGQTAQVPGTVNRRSRIWPEEVVD